MTEPAKAMMAYPELRHPFAQTPIHPEGSTTILYQGSKTTLANTGPGTGLLVKPEDLTQINGFELKPEGACLADLCIPLPEGIVVDQNGQQWFDLIAFADLIGQSYVGDTQSRVWSFSEMPAKRQAMMSNAMAPDITFTDRQGNVINMADLKGKKALIVTWSSW